MSSIIKIIIVGNGGMARSIYDLIQFSGNVQVAGFYWNKGSDLCGLPIYKSSKKISSNIKFVLGMLNPLHRMENVKKIGAEKFIGIKDGFISNSAKIEDGAVITHGAYAMSLAIIEKFAHVHTSSIVGHDCIVGKYSFVGPGCILGGRSVLGDCCRVGMGVKILPDVKLGNNVTVAAGAVVTKSFQSHTTIAGNPAKVIFKTNMNKF